MATMKKAELDTLVRETVIDALGIAERGTKIGTSTFAIPVETPEGDTYAKVTVTAVQRKDTKTNPAFDLDVAVAKYEAELAEKAEKAAAREAAKAEKAAKSAKSEG